jgi:serine/threonine protein kinase/tetratricopeptide (TPR) repeat protein
MPSADRPMVESCCLSCAAGGSRGLSWSAAALRTIQGRWDVMAEHESTTPADGHGDTGEELAGERRPGGGLLDGDGGYGSAAATARPELADAPDEVVGQLLGRYKLLERLGEGGCGVVYVAEQTEPVRRRVALKVIRLGMDTRSVVARFEAERQALAMMDHPNIAKVLDAGATPTGRPYFIMELVRGIRITDYCDENHLTTTERIGLFIKICQAIQHAHQKGIIHRDIKPSNILVTLHDGVPVPKVIDFGIAKATENRLAEATVYTQLHAFIGTPAYMSPEQAEMSGLDIDTRSDIYGLGVLLYELLAGRTPFDGKELLASGIDGMRRTIREMEPVRPSTRCAMLGGEELTTTARRRAVEASRLLHQLKGDLDWIVMKCLEKDRTRRYDTANGLAMDLRRHLNDEPVVARPPSTMYRARKLIRRNRLAFAAAGVVVLALLVGLVVSVFAYIKEDQAYRQSLAARGQAESLVAFMLRDLGPALVDYGRLPLLKQVAEKTVDYYNALPLELRNLETELSRAEADEAMAWILFTSGDTAAAEPKLREAHERYEALAAKYPGSPDAAAGVLWTEWWQVHDMRPLRSSAELDAYQQGAIRRWRELLRAYPDNSAVVRGWFVALVMRASAAAERKPDEAIALGLELLERTQKLPAGSPDTRRMPSFHASILTILATAYDAAGDHDRAVQLSDEAVAQYEKLVQEDPGNLRLLGEAAMASKMLSYRATRARSRDAELIARERYRLLTMLDPSNAQWKREFARVHMMECYYLWDAGQNEAARAAFKRFDSLLQAVAEDTDREKLMLISYEQAALAAAVGDVADARAQLATGEARFSAYSSRLPAGSFDRIQARVRSLHLQAGVIFTLQDWSELARGSRELIAVADAGLLEKPGESELLLRRAVGQAFQGTAMLREGNLADAVPVLQQSVKAFGETPTAAAFKDDRKSLAAFASKSLAEAMASTGDGSATQPEH